MTRLILGVFVGFVLMSVITFPIGEMAPAMVGDRYADAQTGMVTTWYIFVVQWPLALMTSVVSGIVAALVAGREARDSAIRTLAVIFIAIGLFSVVVTFVADLRGDESTATMGQATGEDIIEGEIAGQVARAEARGETQAVAVEAVVKQPFWNLISIPFVVGLGIVLGGGLLSGGPGARNDAEIGSGGGS